jgi:predicted Zn-dependent protease
MSAPAKIKNISTPDEFDKFAESMGFILHEANSLDYEAAYRELDSLSVELEENPSLQTLNAQFQRVQGAKDRANKILRQATRNHLLHKRTVEILQKGWPKLSDAKSQDKREAEAALKLAEFMIAAAEAESFWRGVSGIAENLNSQHEALANQAKDYTNMLRLRDFTMYMKDGDPLKAAMEADGAGSVRDGDDDEKEEKKENWFQVE